MCTVTFVAQGNHYALGINRDEQRSRAIALPADSHRLSDRIALFPSEPSGGTWIGVNDSGVCYALINWYSVPGSIDGETVSRGGVVISALQCDLPDTTDVRLTELPLTKIKPFRLIGVFPMTRTIVEWRWDLHELRRHPHPWQTNVWISSGLDELRAQQTRGDHFTGALQQSSSGTTDWLRRFHQSHNPKRGPFSVCMHREEAETVSYTEVIVSQDEACLRYTPGAPCCTPPGNPLRLMLHG